MNREPSHGAPATPLSRLRAFFGRAYSGIAFTGGLRKVVLVALLVLTPLLAWIGYQSIMDFVITPARNKAELTAEFDKIHLPEGFELVGTETFFDASCKWGGCPRIINTYVLTISQDEAQKIAVGAFEQIGYKMSSRNWGGKPPFAFWYDELPGSRVRITVLGR